MPHSLKDTGLEVRWLVNEQCFGCVAGERAQASNHDLVDSQLIELFTPPGLVRGFYEARFLRCSGLSTECLQEIIVPLPVLLGQARSLAADFLCQGAQDQLAIPSISFQFISCFATHPPPHPTVSSKAGGSKS